MRAVIEMSGQADYEAYESACQSVPMKRSGGLTEASCAGNANSGWRAPSLICSTTLRAPHCSQMLVR
jgi:hypothetical protein